MFQRKKKIDIPFTAFLQIVGVVFYCFLIGSFFNLMAKMSLEPPGFLGIILMLFLLVFSAAITGSLIFGYSAFLALNNRIKEALSLLAHTFLFGFISLIIILFVVLALGV